VIARTNEDFLRQLTAVHLQWFAAEDEGRTEEPTEHKIQKAREEGKVAKSQDVTSSIVLLFSVITLWLVSSYLFETLIEMTSFFVMQSTEIDVVTDATVFPAFYGYFIRLALPIAAVAFVAAVMGNVVQVGFLFTTKPITPDVQKITPKFGKFFKRALFSSEALFNLAKSLGKVLIIGVLAFLNVRAEIGRITNLVYAPFLESLSTIADIAFRILVEAAVIFLALSVFDYLFQRKQHMESLKMTRQEVKEERKTYEGDPLVKSRLRQRMRDILQSNMVRNVEQADVVVTNPTHFAVAMEYRRESMNAPTVTAKGQDNIALRIREVAAEHEVPVIENKPLARALYSEVEIGDEIPEKYYEAVVAVLKQVYTMSGRSA
jgi:flagellar biosynthetic protein FlhB